jgi:SAM-dependent methyltransferase
MKPHLEKAHQFWRDHLRPSDCVIDATCGNGKDTAILARLVPEGHIYTIDIQQDALKKAQSFVSCKNVTFLHQCHSHLPNIQGVKLIVYNLGYLPGGDKRITSQVETTLASLNRALDILPLGGALSIICYPGHPEGAREQEAVQKWSENLSQSTQWSTWKTGSPTLLIVIKVNNLV